MNLQISIQILNFLIVISCFLYNKEASSNKWLLLEHPVSFHCTLINENISYAYEIGLLIVQRIFLHGNVKN